MKNLAEMDTWNLKQLRSVRINLNNRIQAYTNSPTPKDLQKSNPLFGLGKEECETLLSKVRKIEKKLSNPKEA